MMLITFTGLKVNYDDGEWIGYTTMIVAFSTIFFAIKSYRDNHLDGIIGFGKAFKIGLGITLVATFFYIVSWMIISNTIATDFMSEYFNHSVQKLKESNLSQSEIDKKISDLQNFFELYKNPFVKIGMTFLEIFPVGAIISTFSALILKRKVN